MITAAAAAAIVVVAGALITWRITGDADLAPADSGPTTVNTTARPTTTSTTTTTTTVTTTLPLVPDGGSSHDVEHHEHDAERIVDQLGGERWPHDGGVPDYDAYGTSYPIRLCHTGPAVRLIQERSGAPEATACSVRRRGSRCASSNGTRPRTSTASSGR